jgi:hypothetical protein
MPSAREKHGYSSSLRSCNNLIIAHTSARLYNGGNACINQNL